MHQVDSMSPQERRASISLALVFAFRMLGLFMVLPVLATYGQQLQGATPLLIGMAIGAYGLTQAVLQIPFGMLSDRIGRKPVIIFGLVLFAAGGLLAAGADSIQQVIAGRILQGAGAIAAAVMALVADSTREQHRTKAMAMIGMSIGLAFAVAMVAGPVVAGIAGLGGVFLSTSMLAIVGIGLVLLVVPGQVTQADDVHRTVPQRDLAGDHLRGPEAAPGVDDLDALRNPRDHGATQGAAGQRAAAR